MRDIAAMFPLGPLGLMSGKPMKTKIITAISILSLCAFLTCVAETEANPAEESSFVRGYAFAQLGEYEQARQEYSQYIRGHPRAAEAYNNLGNASLYLDLLEDARAAHEKAILEAMDLAIPHYNLANLLATEEPMRAISEYEAAIERDPDFLEAYNNLAIALASKNPTAAVACLRKALELSTGKVEEGQTEKVSRLHFNLACLLQKQVYAVIQRKCDQSFCLQKSPAAKNGRPAAQKMPQQRTAVTERWGKKITACGDDTECKKRAVSEWRQELKKMGSVRQPDERLAADTASNTPASRLPLHHVDSERSAEQYDRCLEQNRQEFAEVVRQYMAALQHHPLAYEYYNNLGTIYLETGQMEEAIQQYRKALRVDPYSVFVHNNLAVAFFRQGKVDEAQEEYELVSWLRQRFLFSEPSGQYRQQLATSVKKGRMAERGLGESTKVHITRMRHFRPKGYQHTVPLASLWNTVKPFAAIDLPARPSKELRAAMMYFPLPESMFQLPDTTLLRPTVRILSVFSRDRRKFQIGTGFVVARDGKCGILATAYHNLYLKKDQQIKRDVEAMEILIQFFTPIPVARRATIIWKSREDGELDLALLRVDEVPSEIPAVQMAKSSSIPCDNRLRIVGNPLGARWQVAKGVLQPEKCSSDRLFFTGEGEELVSGFSGAPVYAADNSEVLGVYTESTAENVESAITPAWIIEALQSCLQLSPGSGAPHDQ